MTGSANDYVATDLHSHSIFSDGRQTPEEVIGERVRKHLDVVALSDHDVLTGVHRADVVARAHGLVLVPAMETTSTIAFGTDHAEQIHVLAYWPPSFLQDGRLEKTRLWQRGERVQAAWKNYVLDFFARQPAEVSVACDVDALRHLTPADFPALQPLIDRVVACHQPTYRHLQLDHVHFWEDRSLFGWTPEQLIEEIRADGARDVVAHPNRVRDKARMDEVLAIVSGVEAYTSRHRTDVAARFRAFAESTGKHWTASSDDHQHKPYLRPPVGTPRRTVDWIVQGA
jgi:hypothetical protein